MKVSIIIPTYNHFSDLLRPCLESVEKYTDLSDKEIIIVSNGSTDETVPYVEYRKKCGLPYKLLEFPRPIGFPKANNVGVLAAEGEYLLFLNNDTYVMKGTKKDLWVDWLLNPFYEDPSMGITGLFKARNTHTKEDFIIFICCMVKKTIFESLGGLDEKFSPGYMEDVDFCIRLKRSGYKIKQVPEDFPIDEKTNSAKAYSPVSHKGASTFNNEAHIEIQKKSTDYLIQKYNLLSKKNILITNNHLENLGGSEVFTYTIAKELERRGYSIDVFTFTKGVVSEKLNTVDKLKSSYDLILVNHNTCLKHVIENTKGFKILTCHGVYPQLEQPILGADAYVSISEEVQDHLKNLGYNSFLVRNGINCERFYPRKRIDRECKNILSMCHGMEAHNNIVEACRKLAINFMFAGSDYQGRIFDIEYLIDKADLVFGLGRGVYEAMASGRNVIVYDTRHYTDLKTADGLVTMNNIKETQKNNCSGRRFKLQFSVDSIVEEIKKYKQEYGEVNRDYALENFNIEKQVNKYLQIWRQNES
jgi:glycosyltransferase involved in cell wall biosynthesis